MTFNYRARSQSVNHAELISPRHAPDFCKDRSLLWNTVELSEKRKDARVAREVEIALPRELSLSQNIDLAREFVRSSFVDEGMVADLCIHDAHGDNPHAHILLTTRHLTPEGFGQKNREWNKDELLQKWRENWEKVCNKHLERHGVQERIDHRTLAAQGIHRTPQKHLGVQASSIEKRTGEKSINRSRHEQQGQKKTKKEEDILSEQDLKSIDEKIEHDRKSTKNRGFEIED